MISSHDGSDISLLVPERIVERVQQFVGGSFFERARTYLDLAHSPIAATTAAFWLLELCRPTDAEVDVHVCDWDTPKHESDEQESKIDGVRLDDPAHLPLLGLVLGGLSHYNVDLIRRKISLTSALERRITSEPHFNRGEDLLVADPLLHTLMIQYRDAIPAHDQASAFALLSHALPGYWSLLNLLPETPKAYPSECLSSLLRAACRAGRVQFTIALLYNIIVTTDSRHAVYTDELLSRAREKGHESVVQQLTIEPKIVDEAFTQAFALSCELGIVEVLDRLLRAASNAIVAVDAATLLRLALDAGHHAIVRRLLDAVDPRGPFIRIDVLAQRLLAEWTRLREDNDDVSRSSTTNFILGINEETAAWKYEALMRAITKLSEEEEEDLRFQLLLHHKPWHALELQAALAAAQERKQTQMVDEILQRIVRGEDDDEEAYELDSVAVERRKSGNKRPLTPRKIHHSWLNGVPVGESVGEESVENAIDSGDSDVQTVESESPSESECTSPEQFDQEKRDIAGVLADNSGFKQTEIYDGNQDELHSVVATRPISEEIVLPTENSMADSSLEHQVEEKLTESTSEMDQGQQASEPSSESVTCNDDPNKRTASPTEDSIPKMGESLPFNHSNEAEQSTTDAEARDTTEGEREPAMDMVDDECDVGGQGLSIENSTHNADRPSTALLWSAPSEGSIHPYLAAERLSDNEDSPFDFPSNRLRSYQDGQEIEANFLGLGRFHAGCIIQWHSHDDSYDVNFAFGDRETHMAAVNIRPRLPRRKPSSAGSRSIPFEETNVVPFHAPHSPLPELKLGPHTKDMDTDQDEDLHLVAATIRPSPQLKPPTSRKHSQTERSGHKKKDPAKQPLCSWRELEEWKNVDLILNRKRRLVHGQSGNVESTRVPWGEEFAAIQSLKRFAVQHPDVLREHIETQLQEVVAASSGNHSTRSAVSSSACRDALLLVKDLSFLLKQRMSPYFDVILPVVLPAVFSADKRFLCDTAYEALEALVLHCSGRKLARQLLQFGAEQDDLRLVNLTSVYVEKCIANMNASGIQALATRSSSSIAPILTALASLLICKSAPSKIAAQKTLQHFEHALGDVGFERLLLHAKLPEETIASVLRSCGHTNASVSSAMASARSPPVSKHSPLKQQQQGHTMTQSTPSILQRMVIQRQNRVFPSPVHK